MSDHDRARLRTTRRLVLAGPLVGVLVASISAIAGGDGRLGLALVLLCSAAGCVTAAVVTLVQAAVDEARRRPVALRRVGWAGALVLATLLLVVLLGGVIAGASVS